MLDIVELSRLQFALTAMYHLDVYKRQALAARSEKRVPMTRLRKRVAERLLEAKNSTAMLTTFNEVNMKPIKMCIRDSSRIAMMKTGCATPRICQSRNP